MWNLVLTEIYIPIKNSKIRRLRLAQKDTESLILVFPRLPSHKLIIPETSTTAKAANTYVFMVSEKF